MDIKVTLEGTNSTWTNGYGGCVIDIELTLGMDDNASKCNITLADPEGTIAATLIQHSLTTGGIQLLPKPVKVMPEGTNTNLSNTQNTSTTVVSSGTGIVSRGSEFSNPVLAFADLIAYKEVPDSLAESSYYANNGVSGSQGYFSKSEATTGFPSSAGSSYNVGRYQFNRGDYKHFSGVDPRIKDYTPQSQDLLYLAKMKYRKALQPLLAGDIPTAITRAGKEWASLPGSPYGQVQASWTLPKAIEYYKSRLAYYNGMTTSQPLVNKASTPTASGITQELRGLPKSTSSTDGLLPISGGSTGVFKGYKLIVDVNGVQFSYYHQSTETDENGVTKVGGQGIRWILSRRKRNTTYKELSLKQLAQKIASSHKVQLNWLATFDPVYEHLDQTGITDYQLLLRECTNAGLFVSEDKLQLTVKQLDQLKETSIILAPNDNLISYRITDKAMDTSKAESIDSKLQGETKVEIDPITGQFKLLKPDMDSTNTNAITGKSVKQLAGKLKAGYDATAQQLRARVKRIKGLPSSFTVPLTMISLAVTPLSVLRTRNIPGNCLNRVWMVGSITHKLAVGTTTYDCFSPIEVLDTTEATPTVGSTPKTTSDTTTNTSSTGKYIIPTTGTVTSLQGYRIHPISGVRKLHAGVDIGNRTGTQVVASDAGVVTYSGWMSGYGNIVIIRHSSGETTRYGHGSKLVARVGQQVKQGELVMLMGNTGGSTGSHLHFERRSSTGAILSPTTISAKLGRVGTSVLMGTT